MSKVELRGGHTELWDRTVCGGREIDPIHNSQVGGLKINPVWELNCKLGDIHVMSPFFP